jgi:hypothetical protein
MDGWIDTLPGIFCCHYGAHELHLPPLFGTQTAIYRCLLWLHCVDSCIRHQGRSRVPPPPSSPSLHLSPHLLREHGRRECRVSTSREALLNRTRFKAPSSPSFPRWHNLLPCCGTWSVISPWVPQDCAWQPRTEQGRLRHGCLGEFWLRRSIGQACRPAKSTPDA